MGIKGLWELLDSERVAERKSFKTLTIAEGFEGTRLDRLYYIGVDASVWAQQLQRMNREDRAETSENPELCTFFHRLAKLVGYPLHAVFVVDGPLRPPVKRKKHAKTTPQWMLRGMQRLVNVFGFSWLQGTGEAGAELAKMNELGVIDAILSDDSDLFLYGARVVIRNLSYENTDPDIVTVYRAIDIFQDAKLARGDLIFFTLLLGCDYDPIGLKRCGLHIAHGLAKYGLGRSLYNALRLLSLEQLETFLVEWRMQLCDKLRTDPSGFIGRR
ncbi:PIN domain-like protein [Trametes meyenii]|nr:PIN domain-like protein [Trametes meyenii]